MAAAVDLPTFAKEFSAFARDVRRAIKEFLPREKGRFERLAKAVVQTSVYDVWSPTVYERTYDFKNSIRAYLPNESNPYELWIDSDPQVARAKLDYVKDGYAQFIAGEGPGIGFLSNEWNFPRKFHVDIHRAVSADATKRFNARIDKAFAKL